LPGEAGQRFYYGKYNRAALRGRSWDGGLDGTEIVLGQRDPDQPYKTLNCDVAGADIYCLRFTDASPEAYDARVERFDLEGRYLDTLLETFENLADRFKLGGSEGTYGPAVDDDALYLAGGSDNGEGYLEKYDRLTGELIASVPYPGAERIAGLDVQAMPGVETAAGPIDCDGGCLFGHEWQSGRPSTTQPIRVHVFDLDLAFHGVLDLGESYFRNAPIMVSDIAPHEGITSAVFFLGHFAKDRITVIEHRSRYPGAAALAVGQEEVWSVPGLLSDAATVSGLAEAMNRALGDGRCDCEGCEADGGRCRVPLRFAAHAGSIRYRGIDVDYDCGR
ncbi:MAG: hypothetical protein ACFCGT_07735, partial [Sandaracinaceae bacterium]